MAIGFVAITVFLEPHAQAGAAGVSLLDPLRALRHRGLLPCGLAALFYNFGFFTLLAFTPFPLGLGAHELGFVFFGWGLMLAVFSVFVAPAGLSAALGVVPTASAGARRLHRACSCSWACSHGLADRAARRRDRRRARSSA